MGLRPVHKVNCPVYLHDKPIPDDHNDIHYRKPGIHLAPHYSKDYPGYYRFVFVWKDGTGKTEPYQIPGRVWDKLSKLLEVVE